MPTQEDLDRPIFSYESKEKATSTPGVRIRYVGLTTGAMKFVRMSLSGRYYSDSERVKPEFEAITLVEDLCGEKIIGWLYDKRYVEKVQRKPWRGKTCFIYTCLVDLETGKKMFRWERGLEEKLPFNYETGKFSI